MLCQLNIHMKNNKGYYNWIHSMKNAAMESHFNGQKMLTEAKRSMGGGHMTERGQRSQSHEERAAAGIGRLLRDIGISDETIKANLPKILGAGKETSMKPEDFVGYEGTDPSYENLKFDPAVYAELKAEKEAEDLKVPDVTGDNVTNVDDVIAKNKLDNADGVQDTKVGPKFTNPIGAEARLEMGFGVPGDEELAAKLKQPEVEQDEDEDYWRRTMMADENTVMKESLNQKISRLLKG